MLTGREYIRYSRQIMLEEHGERGQQKLQEATVLIVGLGGLGCPAAQYLVSAGVGRLLLIDDDRVEVENLHRQILYSDDQVGLFKVEAAKERLGRLNPNVDIEAHNRRATADNLTGLIERANPVLDCSDNIETRYAINEAACQNRTFLVVGAAIRYEAQIISFDFSAGQPGCYQCLIADLADASLNCSTSGVLGPILGIAGSMQALSAIKAITGHGFVHNLWQCFDGRNQQWISIKHTGAHKCSICAAQ